MITIPQLLPGLFLLLLFAVTFYTCFRSTKGPVSISNLMAHLLLLKTKFENESPLNPKDEREIMEVLQNKTKTSCSGDAISKNKDLRTLFIDNCRSVNAMIAIAPAKNKTSWLQFGALMNDFNEQYFTKKADRNV